MGEAEGGGLINFPPVKRGGLFERGGLIEDLRYFELFWPSTNLLLN